MAGTDNENIWGYWQTRRLLKHNERDSGQQQQRGRLDNSTYNEENQNPECLRIVLIGKTGSGKSSSGNTILGRREFEVESSQTSVTKSCQKEKTEVDGRPVVLVDTPALFESTLSHKEVYKELVKCISLLAPGPHVFLLVLNIGQLTAEDKMLKLNTFFGKTSEKYMIVLLTGGDSVDHGKWSIEEYINEKSDDSFKKLIANCGGRFHVFNNYDQNRTQVNELITKIDAMLKENGGSYFTNEMLQQAETAIQKETNKILKEKEKEMKREEDELEIKHKNEIKTLKNLMKEQRSEVEQERKLKDEQLKEMKGNINKELELRKKEHKIREKEERKRREQEETKWKEQKKTIKDLEEKIRLKSKSKVITDKELDESRENLRKLKETWEKEQKELWEKRKQEDEQRQKEELEKLSKCREEYLQEKVKQENRAKEEVRIRREQEEKEPKELEEKHKRQQEHVKKRHEEEARRKAEEFNEFKEKREEDLAALRDKHMEEVTSLKKQHEIKMKEKQKECENFMDSSAHKEKSLEQQMQELQDTQNEEMNKMILMLLMQNKKNRTTLKEIQKKHRKRVDCLDKELSVKQKREHNEQTDEIKKRQKQERKMSQKGKLNQSASNFCSKSDLAIKHKQEIHYVDIQLMLQHQQNKRKQLNELKKQYDQEVNEFKQKVLEDYKITMKEELDKLLEKHKQEMNNLKQQLNIEGEDTDREELKDLAKKHLIEMNEMQQDFLTHNKHNVCIII